MGGGGGRVRGHRRGKLCEKKREIENLYFRMRKTETE